MPNRENLRSIFTGYLTQCHTQLFAYVHSLVRDMNDVEDVMQRTTIVLWEKFSTFDSSRSFYSWACGVARLEAMNFIRKQSRDPHCFSVSLAGMLAEEFSEQRDLLDERSEALAECLSKLPAAEKQLVDRCYGGNETIHEVATEIKRTTHSLYNSLRRIRRHLYECVQRTMKISDGAMR